MGRIIVCQHCGMTKGHCARNLCQKCYDNERFNGDLSKYPIVGRNRPSKRITAPCPRCGKIEPLTLSNGLCEKCYHKSAKNNNIIVCANCGQSKSHDSHGLCGSCASSKRIRENNYHSPVIVCSICGEQKPHHARGLCTQCYRREHKRTWKKRIIVCGKCGRTIEHIAHGLCMRCYLTPEMLRRYRHRRESIKKNLPMTLTLCEWDMILEKYNHSCAYCGRDDLPLTQEHWLPSSRGGGYTAGNIVPSCAPCNSRKRSMTGDEFIAFLEKENNYAS